MQEIEFFEEGEPMIDGEPGDLKVQALHCLRYTVSSHIVAMFSLLADHKVTGYRWHMKFGLTIKIS